MSLRLLRVYKFHSGRLEPRIHIVWAPRRRKSKGPTSPKALPPADFEVRFLTSFAKADPVPSAFAVRDRPDLVARNFALLPATSRTRRPRAVLPEKVRAMNQGPPQQAAAPEQ